MKPENMLLLKDALNKELAYYQQVSHFLAELPDQFQTQRQAENATLDLISVMDIEGTTRRLYREHIWQSICTELLADQKETRLSAHLLTTLGYEDHAQLLLKVQQWSHTIQRQLVKVVIYLKQFNRLNHHFLRLHDSLSNPAYTGKGLVRPKPDPRHTDQEA